MASSSALKGWDWGMAHAIINPLVFLDPDGRFPLLPLFVNCYGEEAGPDYPPRPTPKRCYELGRGIRRFLDTRDERVAVVASSSWSHSFLAHRFQRRSIDIETDRRNLELVRTGQGSKLAELTPEEIQESGDHEILNWVIALGDTWRTFPAEIVDVRESPHPTGVPRSGDLELTSPVSAPNSPPSASSHSFAGAATNEDWTRGEDIRSRSPFKGPDRCAPQ